MGESVLIGAVVNGLLLGGLYALNGMGLSLVFGVMRIINLAHGEMLMLGMYLAFWAFTLAHVHPYLAIVLAFPLLFVLGWGMYRALVGPVLARHAPEENQLLLTLGIGLGLTEVVRLLFTAQYRTIYTSLSTATLVIGPVSLSVALLSAFLIASCIACVLFLVLTRTEVGRALRATAQDPEAAELVGIDGERIYRIAFGIGAGLAGAAGALLLPIYYLTPTIGGAFTLKAFIVTVLGGMGSVVGALVGGLALGVAETLGAVYVSTAYRDIIGYLVFILILSLRPAGLLGRSRI
jgi:branched-chain amino acid transport system permease protein